MSEIVTGWMSDLEKEWLAEQAKSRSAIAEVGCWMGVTTCVLANATAGIVYAVDTFLGSSEHVPLLAGKPENFLFQKFMEHTAGQNNIVPYRGESVWAAEMMWTEHVRIDMVFIDAAHDYANVKADILAWRKLLVLGGLLCGHDYDAGREGVVRAVNELVPNIGRGPGSIWYSAC